jgi:hypothetical protein
LEPKKKDLTVFWKPAKSREDQFKVANFDETMLSSPYKYDMKIQGNLENETFKFKLLNSVTLKDPDEKKETVTIESVEKFGEKEVIIRFKINLCSFHYGKMSFKLLVEDSKGNIIYLSTTFLTSARRKEITLPSPKKNIDTKKEFYLNQKISKNNNAIQFMNGLTPLSKQTVKYFMNYQNPQINFNC